MYKNFREMTEDMAWQYYRSQHGDDDSSEIICCVCSNSVEHPQHSYSLEQSARSYRCFREAAQLIVTKQQVGYCRR
jgi:hypothetical protein